MVVMVNYADPPESVSSQAGLGLGFCCKANVLAAWIKLSEKSNLD
jgi:hypothetical protein